MTPFDLYLGGIILCIMAAAAVVLTIKNDDSRKSIQRSSGISCAYTRKNGAF